MKVSDFRFVFVPNSQFELGEENESVRLSGETDNMNKTKIWRLDPETGHETLLNPRLEYEFVLRRGDSIRINVPTGALSGVVGGVCSTYGEVECWISVLESTWSGAYQAFVTGNCGLGHWTASVPEESPTKSSLFPHSVSWAAYQAAREVGRLLRFSGKTTDWKEGARSFLGWYENYQPEIDMVPPDSPKEEGTGDYGPQSLVDVLAREVMEDDDFAEYFD